MKISSIAKISYVVKNENTLGFLQEGTPYMTVLQGDMTNGGHNWKNGPVSIFRSEIRPATKEDFDNFNVSIPPDFINEEKEKISEKINVNGVERPTRNNLGELIWQWFEGSAVENTEEGIRNFWQWFGDSLAVDSHGRPMVTYHGTDCDFDAFDIDKIGSKHWESKSNLVGGFFFTDKAKYAQGPIVKEVYLKIQNAKIDNSLDYYYATDRFDMNSEGIFNDIFFGERDGMITLSPTGSLFVAVNPNQIKSATNNNGEFNPDNPSLSDTQTNECSSTFDHSSYGM